MEAVAANGHNLTILSADVEKNPPKGMHYILLENIYSYMYDDSDEPLNIIEMAKGGPIDELIDYYKFGTFSCEGECFFFIKKKSFR
jgi:glucuronosyltransferase